jgi:hypothetical protein
MKLLFSWANFFQARRRIPFTLAEERHVAIGATFINDIYDVDGTFSSRELIFSTR